MALVNVCTPVGMKKEITDLWKSRMSFSVITSALTHKLCMQNTLHLLMLSCPNFNFVSMPALLLFVVSKCVTASHFHVANLSYCAIPQVLKGLGVWERSLAIS